MFRKIYYAIILALFAAFSVQAQFIVKTVDEMITHVDGNATFNQSSEGAWSVAGIDIANVTSISRAMLPVVLDTQAVAQYYEGVKSTSNDGSANYYFCLSQGETSYDAIGQLVPINPGMMMCIDLYAAESADVENAIIPEGVYPITADCIEGTVGVDYTFARVLLEDGTVDYKILGLPNLQASA